ncbi:MAG: hypothetical protein IRZ10_09060 [Thermoflavifilum sp.]|nr:hypothetical protein [Thermoflavifilum sp.]MCL6514558.1 hypothetical protein [Alicyclobacillus sp.]
MGPIEFLWLATLLLAMFLGFAAGRRLGIQQGRKQEQRTLPIELRVAALERGICPICGARSAHDTIPVESHHPDAESGGRQ